MSRKQPTPPPRDPRAFRTGNKTIMRLTDEDHIVKVSSILYIATEVENACMLCQVRGWKLTDCDSKAHVLAVRLRQLVGR